MNEIVMRLDDWGKPAWIALMVAGFIVFWPIGLALLAFLIWSGRMGCRSYGSERWQSRFADKMDRMDDKMSRWGRRWGRHAGPSSGNVAFDEYREETLRRLEEEQKEFRDFLDRLRFAKDRSEFDQFMTDRKTRAAEDGNGNGGSVPQTGSEVPA